MQRARWLALAVALAGCDAGSSQGSAPTPDVGAVEDSGGAADSGVDTASGVDTGGVDAATTDSAAADSATPDDAKADDASAADSATPDDASADGSTDGATGASDATGDVTSEASADAATDAGYVRPDTIEVPPLASFDAGVLPKDDAGRPILSKGTGMFLGLDVDPSKRGPMNALAGCAGLVSGCYQPGKRSLDACVVSAPKCATAKPWEEAKPCCPVDCVSRYEAARTSGVVPQLAIYTVLFLAPSCVPGVDAALGVK